MIQTHINLPYRFIIQRKRLKKKYPTAPFHQRNGNLLINYSIRVSSLKVKAYAILRATVFIAENRLISYLHLLSFLINISDHLLCARHYFSSKQD